MGYTLIIAEKPSACKRIAESIGDEKAIKKTDGKTDAYWYEVVSGGRDIVVVPAAGHLFTLKQKSKGWSYPVFDVHWVPSFKAIESSKFSEKFYRNIETLAKDADDFIVATDYDIEGSVIGWNVIRFLCGQKDAARMKFSTMTTEELIESYEHAAKHMDFNQIEAGLTRHYLDWMWGINTTRALTLAVKNFGERFNIISAGRVQGPLLEVLAKKEHEIKKFKPEPFWELEAHVDINGQTIVAKHEADKFWKENEVKKAYTNAKGKGALVKDIDKKIVKQNPPKPFDTTTMLRTINRFFGYSPKQGLDIAEGLYQKGLISYPRTSSQKLPAKLGLGKILKNLAKQNKYKAKAEIVLKTKLVPNEGSRDDPAHPAVYPTGVIPKALTSSQQHVYDLIVHRFFAVFGEPAVRESIKAVLDIGGEKFNIHGIRTIEENWFVLYGRYSKFKEQVLPEIKKEEKIKVKELNKLDKETQPPQRYSQASLLKIMDDKNLGTRATRAQIIQTLYDRHYILGKSIRVTTLGLAVADVLRKYSPEIISEKLTRKFEKESEMVFNGEIKRDKVVEDAKKMLTRIMNGFKKHEKNIGIDLGEAVMLTAQSKSILGPCPNCGKDLKMLFSRRTRKKFVGCSGYPNCKTGFPLPQQGIIVAMEDVCEKCKTPLVQVFRRGARPFRMCLDPECETKKDWLDKKKLKEVQKKSREDTKKAEEAMKNAEKCGVCGKIFMTKRGLTIHTKRNHKGK